MPSLVLGPLLRYVGETEAVIWVETDSACEVEVLGTRERTFCVVRPPLRARLLRRPRARQLARVRGAARRRARLAARRRLPAERLPHLSEGDAAPDRVRLLPGGGAARVRPTRSERTRTSAAARSTRSTRLRCACATSRASEWPDVLLMLGDQVYADEVSPATLAFIETRRDPSELPGERVLDFEDYTRLYLRELGRAARSAGSSRPSRRR